jgi:hypothetical protein
MYHDWESEASCRNKHFLFDIPSTKESENLPDLRINSKMQKDRAKAICLACPVLRQCLNQTIKDRPFGVIRAGASLSKYESSVPERFGTAIKILKYQEELVAQVAAEEQESAEAAKERQIAEHERRRSVA